MQTARLQKKEKNNTPIPEKKSATNFVVEPEKNNSTETGIPLFLQQSLLFSTSQPSPKQRQIIPKKEDQQKNVIQTKLTIGEPGDKYEQEADQVAEAVMRMPISHDFQRVNESKEKKHQKNAINAGLRAWPSSIDKNFQQGVNNPLNIQTKQKDSFSGSNQMKKIVQSPGNGSPLPKKMRLKIEHVLKTDLSQVRLHSDYYANQTADSINAKAFTLQNNIFLGKGQTTNDIKLLAHEAAHVVQQQTMPPRIQRFPDDDEGMMLFGNPELTFLPGTPLDQLDEDVANAIREQAEELEVATGEQDSQSILRVLRRNTGPQMRLVREAYGLRFFADIDRAFTMSTFPFSSYEEDHWGEARALLGDTLTLDEELRTLSGSLSSNRAEIFQVLEQLDNQEALLMVEHRGQEELDRESIIFRNLGPRSGYEQTSRTLANLLGRDSDDYFRAMRIILRKAQQAQAERPHGSISLSRIAVDENGDWMTHEEGGLVILDPVREARIDLVWMRIRQADEQTQWIFGHNPDPAKAFLSLTNLDAQGRVAIAERIRSHDFECFNQSTVHDLLEVAEQPNDAMAIAAAMRAALALNQHDSLGMEIATERIGSLVGQSRVENRLGSLEELPDLSDLELSEAEEDLEPFALLDLQPGVESILHDPNLIEEMVQRSADLWNGNDPYIGWLRNMRVSEAVIGTYRIRHASNYRELFDAVSAIPPSDRSAAVNSPQGQAMMRHLNISDSQREVIDALVAQGIEDGETERSPDDSNPDAVVAGQSMLFTVQRDHPERVFAIASRLTEQQRHQILESSSFQGIERELSRGGVENAVLLSNIRYALEDGVTEPLEREALSTVFRGGEIRSEIRDIAMYEQALSIESRGRRDERRRGFVLWHRLQDHPDMELSSEERRIVHEYEIDRELIQSADDSQRRQLNDAMLGAPLVFGSQGQPDPNMEADYLCYRLADRSGVREGAVAPWNWEQHNYDEAVTSFMIRYRETRTGGVNMGELAELVLLYHDAMRSVDDYADANDRFARDMASMAGCVVGTIVVGALSYGSLTPLAVGALASFAGGTAAASTGYAIRTEARPEDVLMDFSVGAIEGALSVVGQQLASRIVGQVALASRGGASTAVRTASGNAVRQTAATPYARLAESVIDGMIGGAGGELFTTASNEALWDQEISKIIATLIRAVYRGAAMGAIGGAVGFGIGETIGFGWRRLRSSHGSQNADDILHAFEMAGLGPGRVASMDEAAQEALFRARAFHAAGNNDQAARILTESAGLDAPAAQRVLTSLQERSLMIQQAARQMDRLMDDTAAAGLSRELGVRVEIAEALEEGQVLVDYRLGTWGDPSSMSIRVSGEATVGDVLIHQVVIGRVRQFQREARTFRGFFERASAWLRGRSRFMPRHQEVLSELEKHGLMMEARMAALRSVPLDNTTCELLETDILEIREWIHRFQNQLDDIGAPEGVIGSRLRRGEGDIEELDFADEERMWQRADEYEWEYDEYDLDADAHSIVERTVRQERRGSNIDRYMTDHQLARGETVVEIQATLSFIDGFDDMINVHTGHGFIDNHYIQTQIHDIIGADALTRSRSLRSVSRELQSRIEQRVVDSICHEIDLLREVLNGLPSRFKGNLYEVWFDRFGGHAGTTQIPVDRDLLSNMGIRFNRGRRPDRFERIDGGPINAHERSRLVEFFGGDRSVSPLEPIRIRELKSGILTHDDIRQVRDYIHLLRVDFVEEVVLTVPRQESLVDMASHLRTMLNENGFYIEISGHADPIVTPQDLIDLLGI